MNQQNQKNNTLIIIIGILVATALVLIGIFAWQYFRVEKEEITEIKIPLEERVKEVAFQPSKLLVLLEEKENKTFLHFITPQGEEKRVIQTEFKVGNFCGYPPYYAELSKDKICYFREVSEEERVRILSIEGEDQPLTFIRPEKAGHISSAILSPTGKRIVWKLRERTGNRHKTKFFVANIDGSGQRRILIKDFSPRWVQLIKWSKDEKFVYFHLNPEGIGFDYRPDNIYKVDVKSDEITPIFTKEMDGQGLSISSDGKLIVYSRRDEGILNLFIKNLVTREEQNFFLDEGILGSTLNFSLLTAFFSPNNEHLVFNLFSRIDGVSNPFVIDLKNQKKKRLTLEVFQLPLPEFSQISKESKILDVFEYWYPQGWLTDEWIILERRVEVDFENTALEGRRERYETYLMDINQTNLKKISSLPFLGVLGGRLNKE